MKTFVLNNFWFLQKDSWKHSYRLEKNDSSIDTKDDFSHVAVVIFFKSCRIRFWNWVIGYKKVCAVLLYKVVRLDFFVLFQLLQNQKSKIDGIALT